MTYFNKHMLILHC